MENSKLVTTQIAEYAKANKNTEPTILEKVYNVFTGWSPFYARK